MKETSQCASTGHAQSIIGSNLPPKDNLRKENKPLLPNIVYISQMANP